MTDEPLPVLCVRCFTRGRLVTATGYLKGNSLCDEHMDEMVDQQIALHDAIAARTEDA